MSVFKKTINITGIIDSSNGPKFTYDYLYIDITKDPDKHSGLNFNYDSAIFKDKKYVPKEKDKLYFLPGCNIPRFKLKEYCTTHKVAPVKYRVRANVVIAGPQSYEQLFMIKHNSRISFDTFNTWINTISPLGDLRFLQLKNDLKTVNENFDYITIDRTIFVKLIDKLTPFNIIINIPIRSDNNHPVGNYSTLVCVKDEESLNILNDMSDSNGNFYSQDDVLAELNTGMVLNGDNYQNIRNLLMSADNENTKLAMECMSNCDFKQSALSVLLLLREFGNKMYGTKNKDHVNFKALLTYFKISNLTHIGIDTIIDSLLSKDLLTQTNLDMFLPEVEETMTSNLGYRHFSVQTIKYSDEIMNALAKEYPVVIETTDNQELMMVDHMTIEDIKDATTNIEYLGNPIVVEINERGEPLMSSQMIMIDMSKPDSVPDTNFDL